MYNLKFEITNQGHKIIPYHLYLFILFGSGKNSGNIYVPKKLQFFWSSKISIIQLFDILIDTKMKIDADTLYEILITYHMFISISMKSFREGFLFVNSITSF